MFYTIFRAEFAGIVVVKNMMVIDYDFYVII